MNIFVLDTDNERHELAEWLYLNYGPITVTEAEQLAANLPLGHIVLIRDRRDNFQVYKKDDRDYEAEARSVEITPNSGESLKEELAIAGEGWQPSDRELRLQILSILATSQTTFSDPIRNLESVFQWVKSGTVA